MSAPRRDTLKGLLQVDPEDEWLLTEFSWCSNGIGYAVSRIPELGELVFIHHLIMGKPLDGLVIDHINRDPLDNRRCNLRYATKAENAINSNVRSERNTYWRPDCNGYVVQVTRNGVSHYGGVYSTIEEAVVARDELLKELDE